MEDLARKLGRIQVIKGSPPCQPGKCIVCGNPGGDEVTTFVDVGLEIDFYGVVYFCNHCTLEAMATLDFVPVEELTKTQESLEEQKFVNGALQNENSELRNAIDSLNRAGFSFGTGGPDVSRDQLTLDEAPKEPESEPRAVDPEPVKAKSRPTKQTNESRSKNVQHNDSSTKFSGIDGLNI